MRELGWGEIIGEVGLGMLLELGVFDGRSFNEICSLVQPRLVWGFDWFYGLPEPWTDQVGGGDPQGERQCDRGGVVPDVADNGKLVIGRVEQTLVPWLHRNPGH